VGDIVVQPPNVRGEVEHHICISEHCPTSSLIPNVRLAWVHVLGVGVVVVPTHLRVHPNDLSAHLHEHVDQE
jgi:hypothetical protein